MHYMHSQKYVYSYPPEIMPGLPSASAAVKGNNSVKRKDRVHIMSTELALFPALTLRLPGIRALVDALYR